MIQGYSDAFDEDAKIDIISSIVESNDVFFDETFGNVGFRMTQKHQFKNPLEPRFLSAEAITAVKGFVDIKVDEKMDLLFNIEIKQERVKEWKSFFKTETSNEEFKEEFKESYS